MNRLILGETIRFLVRVKRKPHLRRDYLLAGTRGVLTSVSQSNIVVTVHGRTYGFRISKENVTWCRTRRVVAPRPTNTGLIGQLVAKFGSGDEK